MGWRQASLILSSCIFIVKVWHELWRAARTPESVWDDCDAWAIKVYSCDESNLSGSTLAVIENKKDFTFFVFVFFSLQLVVMFAKVNFDYSLYLVCFLDIQMHWHCRNGKCDSRSVVMLISGVAVLPSSGTNKQRSQRFTWQWRLLGVKSRGDADNQAHIFNLWHFWGPEAKQIWSGLIKS